MFRRYGPCFSPDEGGAGGGDGSTPGGNPAPVSFFDSLPDEIKGNEAFAAYRELQPADLVKQHAELSGKVKDALIPPGETATEEEKKAFSDRMRQINQVPESVDGYAGSLNLPEGVPADDPMLVAVLNRAHQTGLGPTQVQAAIDGFMDYIQAAEAEGNRAIQQHKDALKIEWGQGYEQRIKDAEATMRLVGEEAGYTNDDVLAAITGTGMMNNPVIVKMFDQLSRHYKEGKLGGQGGSAPNPNSIEEAANRWYPGMK